MCLPIILALKKWLSHLKAMLSSLSMPGRVLVIGLAYLVAFSHCGNF